MRVVETIAEYAAARQELRERGARVAYVATMGALHAGHRALLDRAREHGDTVVVSIFVNPLQFGPEEDYSRYPRPRELDLEVCVAAGVDLVFLPSVTELYAAGRQVTVNAGALGMLLEGASRPGHFDGMLTVVLKLFHIIDPHVAVFGQKDAQQLACIRRMVADLNVGVDIVAAPTVRDHDGLALSSRNRFLSAPDRRTALAIVAALHAAAAQHTVAGARAAAYAVLDDAARNPAFELDYAVLVDPRTFAELRDDHVGPGLLVIAAQVGTTRLIDNIGLEFV